MMLKLRLISFVLPICVYGFACQPVPTAPTTQVEHDEKPPADNSFIHQIPEQVEVLHFPPPLESRTKRPELELPNQEEKKVKAKTMSTEFAVHYPFLDSQKHFDFSGRSFRIRFTQPVALHRKLREGASIPAKKGTLTISPEVSGSARWISEDMLEFTAKKPFDPEQEYTVTLGKLTSKTGQVLEAWSATFAAEPYIVVAGKVLSYLPEAGKPKVVFVYPYYDMEIAADAEMAVIFDQPTRLQTAEKLIRLQGKDQQQKAIRLAHLKDKEFQGVTVPAKHVVLISPVEPLQEGEELKLIVNDFGQTDEEEAHVRDFSVAEALEFEDVSCGYGYGNEICEWDGRVLRLEGNDFSLRFNNSLAGHGNSLASSVQIVPSVANLSVYNWGGDRGRLHISGDFKPSKLYQVRISDLEDTYGNELKEELTFAVDTMPLGASISLPEGVLILDQENSQEFKLTSRNVRSCELLIWPIANDDPQAFTEAHQRVQSRSLPTDEASIKIPVDIGAKRDAFVTTKIDLLQHLQPGKNYLVSVKLEQTAFDAPVMKYPSYSPASRPPVLLLTPSDAQALAVHSHTTGRSTLIQVARLATGEPVVGAELFVNGRTLTGGRTTDQHGVAIVSLTEDQAVNPVVRVKAQDAETQVQIHTNSQTSRHLFPGLANGEKIIKGDLRAMVFSDRGIYRPGSFVHAKASIRRKVGERLVPVEKTPLRIRILGPTGDELTTLQGTSNDMGSMAIDYEIPQNASLGNHQIIVEENTEQAQPLARHFVQVAEFEPPRFTVDVNAQVKAQTIQAAVLGQYLFGAPMDGAAVEWTLTRTNAEFPQGKLTNSGLIFSDQRDEWWEEEQENERWSRAGQGTLDAHGQLVVEQKLDLGSSTGPQEFTLEADVADSSYRHVAGRGQVVIHPYEYYAGIKTSSPWTAVNEAFQVELGVIDQQGEAVAGKTITARLDKISWKYSKRRDSNGHTHYEWHTTRTEVDRCTVTSTQDLTSCALTPPHSGDYQVIAEVDSHTGGSRSIWAWRQGDDEDESALAPTRGRKLDIIADQKRYAPGDRAKLMVRNPYPRATAILTIEQGELLTHRTLDASEPTVFFEVPIMEAFAPQAYATITLLPRDVKGEQRADWKIGAIRLPVSLDDAMLALDVHSDKEAYEPGEKVSIDIDIKEKTQAVANAEVALAIVDEGVLRLTNYHAPNPIRALNPVQPLDFYTSDTRDRLAELLQISKTAGDGEIGAEGSTSTRKNFVQTALWLPDVRTDAQGHAQVQFTLPDNLTRFRIMAVALDRNGKGAVKETSFVVRRPVMMVPAVPRFALVGDQFEAAALLHNNEDIPLKARLQLGANEKQVEVAPHSHKRVSFPWTAESPGEMQLQFSVRDQNNRVRDQVLATIPVDSPGILEHPRLDGAFVREQIIELRVPEKVDASKHKPTELSIRVGQNLWPELGARLEFLLDYPHGCVEQTTSSTLPLLAAKDILPRLGFTGMSQEQLDLRIKAGLERLASMRTSSGGLGYWPGDSTPNVYGTAYAIRAVIAAKEANIPLPDQLLPGMQSYLESQLRGQLEPEVKAAIAQSLAELGALPESANDALFDTAEKQGVFGLASLAIALSHQQGQEDRVQILLDRIETNFANDGTLTKEPNENDFYYYGSPLRSRAQALIAFGRLKPQSPLRPLLTEQLAKRLDSYTTQGTAYALMAVAEQVRHHSQSGAPLHVFLDEKKLTPQIDLGAGSYEFRIPFADVKGKIAKLRLASEGQAVIAFMIDAYWKRPFEEADTWEESNGESGPSVYRVFTDAKGNPVDLNRVVPGQVLRVALLANIPATIDYQRRGYLALTDYLPAGFEPIQTDLWTVARAPELTDVHPFADWLRWGGNQASFIELRDDRVHIYFDRFWGPRVLATYLVRVSTPGTFVVPPTSGEFMYLGNSQSYGSVDKVIVQ